MGAVFKLKNKKLTLSENDVERQITDFMRLHGWTPVRNHVGTFCPWRTAKTILDLVYRMLTGDRPAAEVIDRIAKDLQRNTISINEEGMADWLFVHSHYPAIWVEVKAPGKKPEKAQLEFLRDKRLLDQVAVWTDNFESFVEWYRAQIIPYPVRRPSSAGRLQFKTKCDPEMLRAVAA